MVGETPKYNPAAKLPAFDRGHDFGGSLGNVSPGAINGGDPRLDEKFMVIGWNDATADHQCVARALSLQFVQQFRYQCLVPGGKAGDAHDMHIVLHRFAGSFLRRLEKCANIDIEADVGEGGRDDFGAAVMSVLTEFDY